MCLETFENKTLVDYQKGNEWNDFVNRNYNYAQTKSKCFDWIGKCERADLPSEHPYWEYITEYRESKDKLKKLEYLLNQLVTRCPNDGDEGAMMGMSNVAASAIIGVKTTKEMAIKGLCFGISESKEIIINFAKKHSNNLR